MPAGGSLSLRQLRDRGFDDVKIAEMGGTIQGGNVVFTSRIGGFDSTGAILKLPPRPPRKTAEEWIAENGPRLWSELHRWALAFVSSHALAEPKAWQWLSTFANRLPCGSCRRHWREIVKANPPAFDSADALFAWTVDRHNEVNAKLGKATINIDVARAIHQQRRSAAE